MLGYKILLVIVSVLLPIGVFSVFRHPHRFSDGQLRFVCIFLFLLYLFPWFEVATNYPKENPVFWAMGPLYNVIPVIFFLTLAASLIPQRKIRDFLFLTVCLLPIPLLLHLFATLIYHMKNTNYFNERTALYVMGEVALVLLFLSLVFNRSVVLKIKSVCLSIGFMLGLYGVIYLLNAIGGTAYFGLTSDGGYLLLPSIWSADSSFLIFINFAFIAVSMALCAAVFFLITKKEAPEEI